uniref:Uncharacterized protein n=1 Tax=Meloidogyne floridensis TaxID=298350 RepID=A0A915P0P7_9BILA
LDSDIGIILGTTDNRVSARGGRTHPIMEEHLAFSVQHCVSTYIVKLAGSAGAMAVGVMLCLWTSFIF